MSLHTRGQKFVDLDVQGRLMARTAIYMGLCLFNVLIIVLIWRLFTGPARLFYTQLDDMWRLFAPAIVASLLLIPLVVLDMVRFSNRFAGPLHRLRSVMKRLANGENVEPVTFRGADFWKDIAAEFNQLSAEVKRLRELAGEPPVAEQRYTVPTHRGEPPVAKV